ncbi:hypothetical protein SGFS_007240 [Streptomyces graminofaciens]|uniref:Uncharacterized protein n=1 Tax=Streptomyces graminofaciens TaxID=68212 RepID=A0ABM7F127_9ACTN|nr:hypothetical protein SGFS_007240 [Streptomyces graminofaciens]
MAIPRQAEGAQHFFGSRARAAGRTALVSAAVSAVEVGSPPTLFLFEDVEVVQGVGGEGADSGVRIGQ